MLHFASERPISEASLTNIATKTVPSDIRANNTMAVFNLLFPATHMSRVELRRHHPGQTRPRRHVPGDGRANLHHRPDRGERQPADHRIHDPHRGTTSLIAPVALRRIVALSAARPARPLVFGCLGPIPSVLLGDCRRSSEDSPLITDHCLTTVHILTRHAVKSPPTATAPSGARFRLGPATTDRERIVGQ